MRKKEYKFYSREEGERMKRSGTISFARKQKKHLKSMYKNAYRKLPVTFYGQYFKKV